MDEISYKVKNWLDPIINLRVTFPWLLKKPLFDFVIIKLWSMFLKLGDNVDMDKISDKFEKRPDPIVNSKVSSPWLLKKASVWIYHRYNSFSFDQMFLKRGDNVDINEICDKFENWPDRMINLRVASPW